jgi:hypothetical protein
MRLKPDGSLDYRPSPPSSRPAPARTAEELERMRDRVVEELLRGRQPLTPEEAKKLIDGF